jgi:hypothetical protein
MPLSSQLRKAITNWRKNSKSQKTLPFFSGIFFLWNQNQKQKAVRKNVYYAHRIPTKIIYYRLRYYRLRMPLSTTILRSAYHLKSSLVCGDPCAPPFNSIFQFPNQPAAIAATSYISFEDENYLIFSKCDFAFYAIAILSKV